VTQRGVVTQRGDVTQRGVVTGAVPALLAHQGGWDEILLVLGPILIIAGLLMLAKRRVERNVAATQPRHEEPDELDG
jgi:hypothetical protein